MYRLADEEIVNIQVGAGKTSYQVHKNLLFGVSPFFRAGFSGGFKEALEKAMQLPEDDVYTFQRFVSWLYTKKYGLSGYGSALETNKRYLQLARLYVMSDKFGTNSLKNEIIDHLFSTKKIAGLYPPSQATISFMYANSATGSAFRKLLVDWHVWHIDEDWFSQPRTVDVYASVPEFAAELAVALGQRIANPKLQSLFLGNSSALYESTETQKAINLVAEKRSRLDASREVDLLCTYEDGSPCT